MVSTDELARVTAANLDPESGRVLTTAEAIAELASRRGQGQPDRRTIVRSS